MAFKSINEYNEARYSGMFMLKNDGDSADVVIMYRNLDDVLVADAHYIRSDNYNGYVHCLGSRTCPACERGIRIQPKLFIPLYVVETGEVLFWDRSVRFQQVMENDVFSKFANPSEYVYRITRHGSAGDVNTRYAIQAIGKNNVKSYDELLTDLKINDLTEYYDHVIKDWSVADYTSNLQPSTTQSDDASVDLPEYKLTPRSVTNEAVVEPIPDIVDSLEPASEVKVDF